MNEKKAKTTIEVKGTKINNQKIFQLIGELANNLYQLIPSGSTVEFTIPNSKIIVPGQSENGGKLIITKPGHVMQIMANRVG